MSPRGFTIEEKVSALHVEIVKARGFPRPPGSNAQRHYEILKSIAADLRGRQELPRNNTLGEIGRMIERMRDGPRPERGYDPNRLCALANYVVGKWPMISQALEQFGEESAE